MPESIGQRLKQAREARYLTLEKASEATRIRTIFLQALEADDYSVIPSAAQGRGFLRNYAEYLGLDIDEMIAEIQRSAPVPAEVSGPLPEVNLVETEVPPLTDSEVDRPARPFWTSWFGPRPKVESPPDAASTEPAQEAPPAPIEKVEAAKEQPKPRGKRKKKEEETPPQAEVKEINTEEETLPVEIGQADPGQDRSDEVKEEAKTGLISNVKSLFQFRFKKTESQSIPDIEEENAPEVAPDIKDEIPSLPADVIFAEIGAQLRERREMLSLTTEEVERHTKLRVVFVKALEAGSFDKLPSPVQTRGMLANYSTFLDLDTDAVLLRFADALQARRHEKYAETPREKIQTEVVTSMPILRTFIAGDLIFGLMMIAILAALAIWGVGRVVRLQNERNTTIQATAPSIVDVLGDAPLPTASLELTFAAVEATPFGEETLSTPGAPIPGASSNVVVSIFAVERTFVRISVDGRVAFEGRMSPRETKVFEADDQVVVLTGNAAALRITYNGQDLGLMGGMGEVVSRVYLVSGVATPTATIPPTATNTPLTTPTLTPTLTPTPTLSGNE
jgi:cytoskeleton protein RodZ